MDSNEFYIVLKPYSSFEKVMDKDDLRIVEHFSELVTKYPGKAIAVVN
ncbi:MAG: hypothetical protein ACPL1G_00265 [Thermodesulfovibrionales bacterium]